MNLRDRLDLPTGILVVAAVLVAAAFAADVSDGLTWVALALLFAALIGRAMVYRRLP